MKITPFKPNLRLANSREFPKSVVVEFDDDQIIFGEITKSVPFEIGDESSGSVGRLRKIYLTVEQFKELCVLGAE